MIDEPASGVLGPVPVEAMLAAVEELDPGTSTYLRAIPGEGTYHAVVDDEDTDIAWANDLAQAISRRYPGKFYAFATHPDFCWLIEVQGGEVSFNDEGAIDAIARDVGCPVAEP